jgi:hypothetical protein
MGVYQIEMDDDVRIRTFDTDGEAIAYAEIIGHLGNISVMKQIYYEDYLATGYYWTVIFLST